MTWKYDLISKKLNYLKKFLHIFKFCIFWVWNWNNELKKYMCKLYASSQSKSQKLYDYMATFNSFQSSMILCELIQYVQYYFLLTRI